MKFSTPLFISNNEDDANETPKHFKTLADAIFLIKVAIQSEQEDELFYDYLISISPTDEEKRILTSIRNDERNHNKYFKKLYQDCTGKTITSYINKNFEKPKSYIDGIKKAKLDELSAVKKYRDILAGIQDQYYRDMLFEIITDELIHAEKNDYILYLNLTKSTKTDTNRFTLNEAEQLAHLLGIDFSKEKFDINQFIMGLNTELEHGKKDPETNVTNDNPLMTAKIALAHLREFPDYYTRLAKLEEEAKAYWTTQNKITN